MPFGLPAVDAALPGGGLALGALHEAWGAGPQVELSLIHIFSFAISQGLKVPAHAPRKNLQTRHDALLALGYRDEVTTVPDAARLLMEWFPNDGAGRCV